MSTLEETVQAPVIAATTPIPAASTAMPKASVKTFATIAPAKVTADIAQSTAVKNSPTTTGVYAKYAGVIDKMNNSSKMRLARLAAYIDAMAPGKPMSHLQGGQYQRSFLDIVVGIINSPEDFAQAFGVLVQVIKDNRKGCFADTHFGRFTFSLPGSGTDRQAYERLMNLLLVLSSVDDVSLALKQVNLTYSTEFLIQPAGRERIISWING